MASLKRRFIKTPYLLHPSFASSVDENVREASGRLTSSISPGTHAQQLAHSSLKQFAQRHFSSLCFSESTSSAPVIHCNRRKNVFHRRLQVFKILLDCDVLEIERKRLFKTKVPAEMCEMCVCVLSSPRLSLGFPAQT